MVNKMPIKSKKTVKKSRFEKLKDGWIKDCQTGLEWGPSAPNWMDMEKAKKHCSEAGGRLPTRIELQTILDLEKYDPAIDKSVFPDTKSGYYWTSTKCAWNKDYSWCVSFRHGYVDDHGEYNDFYVRPVRASQ